MEASPVSAKRARRTCNGAESLLPPPNVSQTADHHPSDGPVVDAEHFAAGGGHHLSGSGLSGNGQVLDTEKIHSFLTAAEPSNPASSNPVHAQNENAQEAPEPTPGCTLLSTNRKCLKINTLPVLDNLVSVLINDR